MTKHWLLQGINVALFWDKVNFKEYVPLVPTSAHTGDGMGDLIALLVNYSQKVLAPSLMLSQELEAVVLEVRVEQNRIPKATIVWQFDSRGNFTLPLSLSLPLPLPLFLFLSPSLSPSPSPSPDPLSLSHSVVGKGHLWAGDHH